MQTSKTQNCIKVIAVLLAFLILVTAASSVLVKAYYTQFQKDYDTLFIGASNTYYGVAPLVVDETLGTNSVNMASALSSFEGRYALLTHMLEEEPIDTVVMDVAFDALTLDMTDWPFERDVPVVLHFTEQGSAFSYMREHAKSISDYEMVYKNMLAKGMDVILKGLKGGQGEFAAAKGFEPAGIEQLAGEGVPVPEKGEYGGINVNYLADNEEMLRKMAELCQEKGVRIVIQTVPLSDNMITRYTGWDTFHEKMTTLAEKIGCEYYDFNLYKERESLLSDTWSYSDLSHLSGDGAYVYSRVLAQCLADSADGTDISDRFYDSYEEAEQHFGEAQ